MNRQADRRKGFVAVIVLVAMVAAILIVTAALSQVSTRSQNASGGMNAAQADLLCEAAYSLASNRLKDNPGYTGETWQLQSDSNGIEVPAKVVIQVQPTEFPSERKIDINVQLGDNPVGQIKKTNQWTISLPETE
ncbi:hypothetical protein GC197_11570 [bacterium]|nr:hypothetical protein [bacterium]